MDALRESPHESRIGGRLMRQKHLLIERISQLDQGALDYLSQKADLETRVRYLNRVHSEWVGELRRLPNPSMFISYTKPKDDNLFEITKKCAEHHGFSVVTGFDNDRRTSDNVLRLVRDAIYEASVFLCIMSPVYEIKRGNEVDWAPSVWLIEEKGMALALGKPFRLLVQENISRDFWARTTPEKLHSIFKRELFHDAAEEAVAALVLRYNELLEAGLVS
jgi:hypothetical protein